MAKPLTKEEQLEQILEWAGAKKCETDNWAIEYAISVSGPDRVAIKNLTQTIARQFKRALSKVSQLVGKSSDYYQELAQLNSEVERNLSSMTPTPDGSYSVAMEQYLLGELDD